MKILSFFAGFFLLLSWLLPVHFLPWPTFYQDAMAVLALGLLTLALAFSSKSLRLAPMLALLLVLALIPWLQHAFGLVRYLGDAFAASLYLLLLALGFFVGLNAKQVLERDLGLDFLHGLAWVLILGSVLSLVVVLCQYLKIDNMLLVFALEEGARPYANLAQPNNLATLLGMGLASVLYLFETRRLASRAAVYLAALLLFGLALVESRTSWVAAVFILGFWAWQGRKLNLRLTLKQAGAWFVFFVALIFLVPHGAELLFGKENTLIAHAQAAARWDLYKQFVYALQVGPWYGYGWEQINQAQVMVTEAFPLPLNTRYTHNVLLDLLIWNGPILGGLIILLVAIWWGRLLVKANNLAATYAWVALSFFILHAMLEYPHAYAFLLIPAALLLGALQAEVSPEGVKAKMPARLAAVLAILTFAGLAVFWHDYRIVEEKHLQIRNEGRKDFVADPYAQVENLLVLTHMRDFVRFLEMPATDPYNDEQLEVMRGFLWRFPWPYFLHKSAVILTLNGQEDEAFANMMLMGKLYRIDQLESHIERLYLAAPQEPRLWPLLARFGLTPPDEAEPTPADTQDTHEAVEPQ